MSDDPVLERLIKMEARLDSLVSQINELEGLLNRYFELTRALRTSAPPPPSPSMN
jgi:hypothetical protein